MTQAQNVAIESSQINSSGVLLTTGGGTGLSTVGTNGQVLTSNGTTLSWVTPTTTSPGGSTTQVQYNSSGSFAGSANLTWDNTNAYLGIGTTSPSTQLHIANSGYPTIRLQGGTSTGGIIQFKGSDGVENANITSYSTASGSQSNCLFFGTNTSTNSGVVERMRIDYTGKVGIGTSSPSSLLTINNTAGGTGLAITGSGTGTQYITATNTGGNLTQGLDNSVGGLTGNAYGTFIGSYANTAMAIVTNSLVRMNITSTGYVTTPAQPAFNVNLPSTGNSGGVIIFTSVRLNTGSCYNVANGRFTAPVAGTYFFYAQLLMNSGGNDIRFDVNGSAVSVYGESDVSGYQQLSLQQVIALNAGDYVQVDIWSGTQYGGNYNNFCGYLLG